MFNLLCMDTRRLFRSRNFYIILATTTALIVMMVALLAAITNQAVLDAMESMNSVEVQVQGDSSQMRAELESMTQLDFVHECLGSGFLLLLAGVGVTLFVCSDFSSGFVKNICFARPRRLEYVLSKVLVSGIYSGVLTVLGVLLSLVCPVVFGLHPGANPVGHILQYIFWLWLPCWAFALMGLALATLTRSPVLGAVLSVVAGGGLIAQFLGMLCQQFGLPDLSQYLLNMIVRVQCVPAPDMGQITMIGACSLFWAALYTIGSLIAMEKQDI